MNPFRGSPFVLAYQGVRPALDGPVRRSEVGSSILGRVSLGGQAVLEPFAVLRADGHVINAGAELYLGLHSTVHIAHAVYGTTIGKRVSVGANSVVHACTVGDNCVIQDAVSVLDGATVGNGSVVAEGSVVFPRSVLPPGQWCEGLPAVPVRPVDSVELEALHLSMRAPTHAMPTPESDGPIALRHDNVGYIAATVTGVGEIRMQEGSSLWFGCVVDAAKRGITIGRGSNIQDNSVLRSSGQAVTIGEDCTIGHNVLLHDCVIGARVLIGMGSVLAPGTVVPDNVVVAAGSKTTPGQVLDGGWLWGGRPARRMSRLGERMGRLVEETAIVYREYAEEFSVNQAAWVAALAERDR